MDRVGSLIRRQLRGYWSAPDRKERVRLLLRVLSRLVKPGGWRYPGLT